MWRQSIPWPGRTFTKSRCPSVKMKTWKTGLEVVVQEIILKFECGSCIPSASWCPTTSWGPQLGRLPRKSSPDQTSKSLLKAVHRIHFSYADYFRIFLDFRNSNRNGFYVRVAFVAVKQALQKIISYLQFFTYYKPISTLHMASNWLLHQSGYS